MCFCSGFVLDSGMGLIVVTAVLIQNVWSIAIDMKVNYLLFLVL